MFTQHGEGGASWKIIERLLVRRSRRSGSDDGINSALNGRMERLTTGRIQPFCIRWRCGHEGAKNGRRVLELSGRLEKGLDAGEVWRVICDSDEA